MELLGTIPSHGVSSMWGLVILENDPLSDLEAVKKRFISILASGTDKETAQFYWIEMLPFLVDIGVDKTQLEYGSIALESGFLKGLKRLLNSIVVTVTGKSIEVLKSRMRDRKPMRAGATFKDIEDAIYRNRLRKISKNMTGASLEDIAAAEELKRMERLKSGILKEGDTLEEMERAVSDQWNSPESLREHGFSKWQERLHPRDSDGKFKSK